MIRAQASLAFALVVAVGCITAPSYKCQSNAQCVDKSGASGICEADNFCSFVDSACSKTSRRYADGAGNGKANTCVVTDANVGCISDVVGGESHFCMLHTDGSVWCWGANDVGQLGDGSTTDRGQPVRVQTPSGKTFVEIGAGEASTCALATDGTVWCWGANDTSELGVVDASGAPVADASTPVQVMAVSGTPPSLSFAPFLAKHISVGGKHACAIDQNGALFCWGENSDGQCAQKPPSAGGTVDDALYPTAVPGLGEGVVAVDVGDENSACLKDDGSVYEFGGNANGQLGDGTTNDSYVPVQAKITSVAALAAGDEHVCGTKNDGSLWCWGYGAAVGLSTGTDQSAPQRIVTAKQAFAGGSAFHTCAIQGADLLCWGANDQGQIGTGAIDPNNATVFVPTAALITTVVRAAGSTGSTCAITSEGQLWCWGANDRGQLAQGGPGSSSPVPQRVVFACN